MEFIIFCCLLTMAWTICIIAYRIFRRSSVKVIIQPTAFDNCEINCNTVTSVDFLLEIRSLVFLWSVFWKISDVECSSFITPSKFCFYMKIIINSKYVLEHVNIFFCIVCLMMKSKTLEIIAFKASYEYLPRLNEILKDKICSFANADSAKYLNYLPYKKQDTIVYFFPKDEISKDNNSDKSNDEPDNSEVTTDPIEKEMESRGQQNVASELLKTSASTLSSQDSLKVTELIAIKRKVADNNPEADIKRQRNEYGKASERQLDYNQRRFSELEPGRLILENKCSEICEKMNKALNNYQNYEFVKQLEYKISVTESTTNPENQRMRKTKDMQDQYELSMQRSEETCTLEEQQRDFPNQHDSILEAGSLLNCVIRLGSLQEKIKENYCENPKEKHIRMLKETSEENLRNLRVLKMDPELSSLQDSFLWQQMGVLEETYKWQYALSFGRVITSGDDTTAIAELPHVEMQDSLHEDNRAEEFYPTTEHGYLQPLRTDAEGNNSSFHGAHETTHLSKEGLGCVTRTERTVIVVNLDKRNEMKSIFTKTAPQRVQNEFQNYSDQSEPASVRDLSYISYPGVGIDPSKVKKDARYQKKFYRIKRELYEQSKSSNQREAPALSAVQSKRPSVCDESKASCDYRHSKLSNETNALQIYSDDNCKIHECDSTKISSLKSAEAEKEIKLLPEIYSGKDSPVKLISHTKQNEFENYKDTFEPAPVRDPDYTPYPGIAVNLSKIKKDARYQKKFYRIKRELEEKKKSNQCEVAVASGSQSYIKSPCGECEVSSEHYHYGPPNITDFRLSCSQYPCPAQECASIPDNCLKSSETDLSVEQQNAKMRLHSSECASSSFNSNSVTSGIRCDPIIFETFLQTSCESLSCDTYLDANTQELPRHIGDIMTPKPGDEIYVKQEKYEVYHAHVRFVNKNIPKKFRNRYPIIYTRNAFYVPSRNQITESRIPLLPLLEIMKLHCEYEASSLSIEEFLNILLHLQHMYHQFVHFENPDLNTYSTILELKEIPMRRMADKDELASEEFPLDVSTPQMPSTSGILEFDKGHFEREMAFMPISINDTKSSISNSQTTMSRSFYSDIPPSPASLKYSTGQDEIMDIVHNYFEKMAEQNGSRKTDCTDKEFGEESIYTIRSKCNENKTDIVPEIGSFEITNATFDDFWFRNETVRDLEEEQKELSAKRELASVELGESSYQETVELGLQSFLKQNCEKPENILNRITTCELEKLKEENQTQEIAHRMLKEMVESSPNNEIEWDDLKKKSEKDFI